MSLHQELRTGTASLHDAVDAAFDALGLGDRQSYTRFLSAHARALVPAEAALEGDGDLAWRRRGQALASDLAAMGAAPPPPLAFEAPASAAERVGLLYVLEGSRLGGAFLARRLGGGLPCAYLGARHEPGEWRRFLIDLDARGEAGGEAWRKRALAGAVAGFDLFRRAAAAETAAAGGTS